MKTTVRYLTQCKSPETGCVARPWDSSPSQIMLQLNFCHFSDLTGAEQHLIRENKSRCEGSSLKLEGNWFFIFSLIVFLKMTGIELF